MKDIIEIANNIIWSNAFIILALGSGLYFSVKLRFPQVRLVREMIRLLIQGKAGDKGVSSFQAFALAISGRVGTGNIAGVATAIAAGGPGAVFWMWISAFLGSASAYVESTLAQIYKQTEDGEYRGGPAYYILHGLKSRPYAVVFSLVTILSMTFFLPGIQSESIAEGLNKAFGIEGTTTGIAVALLLGAVIFGGVRRIAGFARIVVPFMAGIYMLMAVVIILINISAIPEVIRLIISSAFAADSVFGAMAGQAVMWGMKRGIYSNEAGQGSAPHAAAAAEVEHPAQQGLVQAFSVYIDTLFVCTATAFMILFTGSYNVKNPEVEGSFLVENLPGVEAGTNFTQYAIESQLPGFGSPFVAAALFFFAFTTLLAYYYMAETNLSFLEGKKQRKWAINALRILVMAMVIYAARGTSGAAWDLGDIGVGLMAWLNFIAILLLRKPAIHALKDYEEQLESGVPISYEKQEEN